MTNTHYIRALDGLLRRLEQKYPVILRVWFKNNSKKYFIKVTDSKDASTEITTLSSGNIYVIQCQVQDFLKNLF